jgi:hypothetical protein
VPVEGSSPGVEYNMKAPEYTRRLRAAEGARTNRKLGRNPRTMRLTGELSLLHRLGLAASTTEDFLLEVGDAGMELGVLHVPELRLN